MFNAIKNWFTRSSPRYSLADPATRSILSTSVDLSGVTVDETTALTIATVWRCVNVISQSIAILPPVLYARKDKGKEEASNHPLSNLLFNPNPEMTDVIFKEVLQSHLLLWGNCYAEIVRSEDGRPQALWPIPPHIVFPTREEGQLFYVVKTAQGDVVLQQENILAIPALSFDGIKGYSPIQMARQSLGLAKAMENSAASFLGKAARPSGSINTDAKLGEQAKQSLKRSWENVHSGSTNAGRIVLLDEGMQFNPFVFNAEEMQFLESRKHSDTEICRWFGVEPSYVYDYSRATFNNIEHQALNFYKHCLLPWIVRWEREMRRKLLLPSEQASFTIEHKVDALLRADSTTRYGIYAIAKQWGLLSTNEIRDLENWNDIGPQGDTYLSPLNMGPAQETDAPTQAI